MCMLAGFCVREKHRWVQGLGGRERERVWHGDPNTIIGCNKKTSFLWWPGPLGFIPCWMKMLKMVLYPIHD